MTTSESCRPVYCVGGPCAPSCLRMDDPQPIEMPPDRIQRTAARIRTVREGLGDDRMPDIPMRRAVELYEGQGAPTARELGLYAEACNVSVDWLLTGVVGTNGEGAPADPAQRNEEPAPSCPPGDLYVCPSALEVESSHHGGFDQCCDRPDLHVPLPDGPGTDALSEALSAAAKERYALERELARWKPSHMVTHHTYEGPGLCRAKLFSETCGHPRDDHSLICEGD